MYYESWHSINPNRESLDKIQFLCNATLQFSWNLFKPVLFDILLHIVLKTVLALKHIIFVVYFDQQTGAPHAVPWSKSFVSARKQIFSSFSVSNGKKKGKRENNTKKTFIKGGLPAFKCYSLTLVDLLLCMFFCVIFALSFLFFR